LLIPPANLILRFKSRNAHEPPSTLALANSPRGKGPEYIMSASATWDRIGAVSVIAFAMLVVASPWHSSTQSFTKDAGYLQ